MVTRTCLRYAWEGQNVTQAGPKCHTSRAKMSHKGQNFTQSRYNEDQIPCCYRVTIYVNFPHSYNIIINCKVVCAHMVAMAVLRGGQAASAESFTHPAKRDHRFPPPIAERQPLPNVRIMHRAWQWNCCSLCKISEQFIKLYGSCGLTRFCEISVPSPI